MNLLKRLASLFSGGAAPRADKRYLTIFVLSRRCNEPVSGQVDLLNELSKPDEGEYAFYTRKVLHTTGERRCFTEVEVQLYFNQNKQVVHHEVEGGRWLTSEEYSEELARYNAPSADDEADDETDDQAYDQPDHEPEDEADNELDTTVEAATPAAGESVSSEPRADAATTKPAQSTSQAEEDNHA